MENHSTSKLMKGFKMEKTNNSKNISQSSQLKENEPMLCLGYPKSSMNESDWNQQMISLSILENFKKLTEQEKSQLLALLTDSSDTDKSALTQDYLDLKELLRKQNS